MVNIAPEEPGLYFKTSDSKLFKVGPTFIGTVPPNDGATGFAGNTIGEQWLDVTDPDAAILKIWDGTTWLEISGGGDDGAVAESPNPPANPNTGDLWIDSNTEDLHYWNGSEWVGLTTAPDWNESNSSSANFIKNKPTVTSEFSNDGEGGNTGQYITETGLQNILAGNSLDGSPNQGAPGYVLIGDDVSVLNNDAGYITAASQVKSNWTEGDNTKASFIENKATKTSDFTNDGEDGTSTYVTDAGLTTELSNYVTTGSQITNTSELTNDGDDGSTTYITDAGLATELNNYVTTGNQITKTSELTNDGSSATAAGTTYLEDGDSLGRLDNSTTLFINSAGAPVQSVNSLTGAVSLALDNISDVAVSSAVTNNVLVYNGTSWEAGAGVTAPPSVELKGTFDVSDINTLPASAVVGDTYIQKSATPGQDSIADNAWPDINGQSVADGSFVYYADVAGAGTWIIGSNNVASFQSDWNEANSASNSFIKNKPLINNSDLIISDSSGTQVGVFTTNQSSASTIQLPAPPDVNNSTITLYESDGSTEIGSFSINQALDAGISFPAPPVVNDSTLTINDSSGTAVGSFTTNQGTDTSIQLPAPPDVNNATITLYKSDGSTEIGSFSINQALDAGINLPDGMIEPTSNGSFVRKKNGIAYTWEAQADTPTLQQVTDKGKTTTLDITALGLISSEITGATTGTYGTAVTPLGNVMPLDISKLPPLPVSRTINTFNYSVTVNNPGSGNIYYLNGNAQQTINVIIGDEIFFNYSDDSNTGHSLVIYSDAGLTTAVTAGVTDNTASEVLSYTTDTEGTFYYDCSAHPGMGATITVTAS